MRRPDALPEGLRDRVFSVADADRLAVPRGRLYRADLHRPHRGARSPAVPETIAERCVAYLPVMGPSHFFCHGTAALLHGFPVPRAIERDPALHVGVLLPAQRARGRGIHGHRFTPRAALIVARGRLRMTTEAETWCLLGEVLEVEALVVAGDHLIRRGIVDPTRVLTELHEAVGSVRRIGIGRLREALPLLRPGVRSPMESVLRHVLVHAGLPEPEVNARVHDDGGRFLGEGDLVYRANRLVLEYEGRGHLVDETQWFRDIRRRERFEDAGWSVLRVTADDLFRRRAELVDRVRHRLDRAVQQNV